jgi:hypothetical protein
MATRTRIILDLVLGTVLIVGAVIEFGNPAQNEVWLGMGVIAVSVALILLVVLAFGHDLLQEIADRYPWTAHRWVGITLLVLCLGSLLGVYTALHATPFAPAVRYVGFALFLLTIITPGPPARRASAQQDEAAERQPQ